MSDYITDNAAALRLSASQGETEAVSEDRKDMRIKELVLICNLLQDEVEELEEQSQLDMKLHTDMLDVIEQLNTSIAKLQDENLQLKARLGLVESGPWVESLTKRFHLSHISRDITADAGS
ncbi:hypothetical protein HCH_02878 [Hahella chejuensis KCTC 2396]|uniref:Uncharacterized protein n=1 Tax=Hahella chejuensis (strain KCTC 2396) TaxID=349521 RepID=Q2SI70_HAHCH|nr:hypothetical protein [Hahella chejuensis]ABC29654.1 hypothetical protein HCH_02878 [Hahella chejuensis KCTC 2396]